MSNVARAGESTAGPDKLQIGLLRLILRVSTALGFICYVPSVYVLLKEGSFGTVVADTIALTAVFGLFILDKLPFRLRAAGVCLVYYALGVSLLMSVGAISQIYLFGFSVVTVLLLGVRVGLGAALLSSVSLLVVGALHHAGPDMVIPNGQHDFTEWVLISINFALVNVLITLAVGTVLGAMNDSLKREIVARISLEGERTLLRTLVDTLPDLVFTKDLSGRFVSCNAANLAMLGVDREDQATGKTVFDLYPPALAAQHHADDLDVIAGHPMVNRESKVVDRRGNLVWHLMTKIPLRDAAGTLVGLLGVGRNITDRKKVEADRDRLLAQLQLQIERMPLGYLLSDKDFKYTRWNPAAERIFGFTEAEVLGKHPFDLIVPAESQAFVATIFDRIKAGSMDADGESENSAKDGTLIICEWHNTPMFDDDGAFAGLLSLTRNVTDRRKLEGQLRQSQKMDAVGQLAGGVAHDFNNLLSVVLAYSDLILMDLKADDPTRADVEQIRHAGVRAADLTKQLLMFSRKQVIEPKVLDMNAVLSSVEKMLRRVLGEDIELTFVAGAALGRVRADPGSIEQLIMNLAVNARDAMSVGGRLTMETANVVLDEEHAKSHLGAKPGAYVMLSVTDTGCGMDKRTLARIFEPFFTTKEKGKGTGLGLSTVFGIVQQSGGNLWAYSEPGIGTTFKIYLPSIESDVAKSNLKIVPDTLGGTETILIVEDEDQVRDVARGILQRHGYTVLDTSRGDEAIRICEQHEGPIDLLLSDVVMPKMSGPALAKLLVQARPSMKVLYMSGYTDDAAVRHGLIDDKLAYLQKPLTVETLTRKVRVVLDSK